MSNWPWETPPVGVYFDLSFEDYKSLPCLNASGIKDLNIAPTTFWKRCSWLNPMCDYVDNDTKAKMEGRAYHKRILEGEEAFWKEYALEYEYDTEDKSILKTNDDMKTALTSMGIKGLSGKDAAALAGLVAHYMPQYKTLYDLKRAHLEANEGKELISPRLLAEIELINKTIEYHPDIREYFVGGYPEVTVIFDAFGVRFKARFDYLKVWSAIDLKTFSNTTDAKTEIAVRKAFANYKYHIQGTLYIIALEAAKRYAGMGKIYGEKIPPKNWIDMFAKQPVEELKYAFCQKDSPVIAPLKFHKEEKGFESGFEVIRNGVEVFLDSYKKFGTGFWVTVIREEVAHYDDMPAWINDV